MPFNIPKPSLINKNETTSLPRPSSLLSSNLPRLDDRSASHSAPPRPRRLWTINDTSLRPIPQFFPKLNPNCTAYVSDASPSVVAVRISECLRKRSIVVEYDEEAVVATCLTCDRCHFVINLYKGSAKNAHGVDFSHGVVVECLRVSGSVLSFHRACRAVLQASSGQSTGDDHRKSYTTSVLEFRRLKASRVATLSRPKSVISAAHALEQARVLLKKDRLDCQELGMERLVGLTNPETCGEEVSLEISLQVLQENWLVQYLIEPAEEDGPASATTILSGCASSLLEGEPSVNNTEATTKRMVLEEVRHEGKLRSCALRVLCNSLAVVAEAKMLEKVVKQAGCPLVKEQLLVALVQDLKGANRPPSVVMAGYKLASAHEAALALRCLRILGEHSDGCRAYLQTEEALERLETARACGRSTHLVLQQEADKTHSKMTEEVRSC